MCFETGFLACEPYKAVASPTLTFRYNTYLYSTLTIPHIPFSTITCFSANCAQIVTWIMLSILTWISSLFCFWLFDILCLSIYQFYTITTAKVLWDIKYSLLSSVDCSIVLETPKIVTALGWSIFWKQNPSKRSDRSEASNPSITQCLPSTPL